MLCKDAEPARAVGARQLRLLGLHLPGAPGRSHMAILPASALPSAPRRSRPRASRSEPGISVVERARTCPASPRRSTRWCGAGSTTTEPSTAPSCASSRGVSTSTCRWAMHKFKRFRESTCGRWSGCSGSYRRNPKLFAHWQLVAFTQRPDCGGRMTGDCHVRS